ncbi:urease accessory protein UreE [Acuticoccus sp. I52.16.1]|uniref:urease accessory protein UreE n=1 Tax=Acuticoccus sp. I52.16.1 TaxID=2928472 RepID=UPI001FD3E58D|nr:urease accessory protein UreE [Acuticoccus sp. I52.16.1]UOM34614.1 urease accessory protein UreE [Acuticoccus sp. I52.16.1]
MIRAHTLLPAGEGVPALTVRLGYDDRFRRRLVVESVEGERVLFDLAEATRLRGGDRLALDDGRILAIEADPEDVVDITAPDAATVTRLAWHLGNRHTPTAVLGGTLRIRRDHVLEAMVQRLGGTVHPLRAPFDPEVGAYHDGGGHGHHHHDDASDDHHGDHPHGHASHRPHSHPHD